MFKCTYSALKDFCCLQVNTVRTAEQVHTDQQKNDIILFTFLDAEETERTVFKALLSCVRLYTFQEREEWERATRGAVCEGLSPGHPLD